MLWKCFIFYAKNKVKYQGIRKNSKKYFLFFHKNPFSDKILLALEKIKAGQKFPHVAAANSEDKARQIGDFGN